MPPTESQFSANIFCAYGPVKFEVYSSEMKGKPLYDEARRTITAVEWELTVTALIWATMNNPNSTATNDPNMKSIRTTLMTPALPLQYIGKGFGDDFYINAPGGGVRDVAFGPQPISLDWKPLAGNLAANVVWRVKITVPQCPMATYQNAIMELNFSEKYSIDQEGLQQITITGHVIIPMTRRAFPNALVRTPPDNVDNYRARINPTVTQGFQRIQKDFETSLDKRKLNFTIVDKQLPVPITQFCTRMPLKYTIESSFLPRGGLIPMGAWRVAKCKLQGTVFMAAGQPRSNTYAVFMAVAQDRATNGGQIGVFGNRDLTGFNPAGNPAPVAQPPSAGSVAGAAAAGAFLGPVVAGAFRPPAAPPAPAAQSNPGTVGYFIWDALQIEEDVTGLATEFSLSWYTFCPAGLINIIKERGLWRPVVEPTFNAAQGNKATLGATAANPIIANFSRWATSMNATANQPYGQANISAAGDGDVIIDLCLPPPVQRNLPPPGDGGTPASPKGIPKGIVSFQSTTPAASRATLAASAALASRDTRPSAAGLTGGNPPSNGLGVIAAESQTPPAEGSWLAWSNSVSYREEERRYARHSPMGSVSTQSTGPFNATGNSAVLDDTTQNGTGDIGSAQQSIPDLLVEVRSAAPVVTMTGYAMRVGWQIPRPRILSVNKTDVIGERVIHWQERVVANIAGDVPVWFAEWVIEGMLPNVPKGPLPSLADPIQDMDGGTEEPTGRTGGANLPSR